MKIILITQSNYIPWKGYFDMIGQSDEVVFLDDVQFTRRDWRNRNLIMTMGGEKYLTIPTNNKGSYSNQRIQDVEIADTVWATNHWNVIENNYRKSPYWKDLENLLEPLYKRFAPLTQLSDINRKIIETISNALGYKTTFSKSDDYFSLEELDSFSSTQRLVNIASQNQATHYLTGPAAKAYMDVEEFKEKDIEVLWSDYSDYKPYPQNSETFSHKVSIIDMIANVGLENIHAHLKGENIIKKVQK